MALLSSIKTARALTFQTNIFNVFLLGKAKKVAESMLVNLHKPKKGASVLQYEKIINAVIESSNVQYWTTPPFIGLPLQSDKQGIKIKLILKF